MSNLNPKEYTAPILSERASKELDWEKFQSLQLDTTMSRTSKPLTPLAEKDKEQIDKAFWEAHSMLDSKAEKYRTQQSVFYWLAISALAVAIVSNFVGATVGAFSGAGFAGLAGNVLSLGSEGAFAYFFFRTLRHMKDATLISEMLVCFRVAFAACQTLEDSRKVLNQFLREIGRHYHKQNEGSDKTGTTNSHGAT